MMDALDREDATIPEAAEAVEKRFWKGCNDKDPRGYRGKRGRKDELYRQNYDKIKWTNS